MWEQVSKTAHIAWKKQNHVGPSNLKWTNCLRVWNKSSLTKMRFWKAVPIQEYCPLWGQRTRTTLLSLVRARLPTYRSQGSSFLDLLYTFVVVVHSYLQSRLIKHEWDASFFDVPHKKALLRIVPIKGIWVAVFKTCSNCTGLLPRRACLYHYNMCSSGILLPSAKTYKAWVGHIFLRCGSKSQKLLMSLEGT